MGHVGGKSVATIGHFRGFPGKKRIVLTGQHDDRDLFPLDREFGNCRGPWSLRARP